MPRKGSRAQHFEAVDRAIQSATSKQRDKARGQKSLFGGDDEPSTTTGGGGGMNDVSLPAVEDWTHSQKLAFEKEVLGFYMTSHPLTEFSDQLSQYTSQRVSELRDLGDGKEVLIGGMISSVKLATTKQPSRNGQQQVRQLRSRRSLRHRAAASAWPDDYARMLEIIKPERSSRQRAYRRPRPRAEHHCEQALHDGRRRKGIHQQVVVKFSRGFHTEVDMKRTRDVLARHPGKTPVMLFIDTWDEPKKRCPVGRTRLRRGRIAGPLRCIVATPMNVTCSADLRRDLVDSLGNQGFRFLAAGE
ncbi:MAG: hypothetical protein QM757_10135 [Paludibaculum sp.]